MHLLLLRLLLTFRQFWLVLHPIWKKWLTRNISIFCSKLILWGNQMTETMKVPNFPNESIVLLAALFKHLLVWIKKRFLQCSRFSLCFLFSPSKRWWFNFPFRLEIIEFGLSESWIWANCLLCFGLCLVFNLQVLSSRTLFNVCYHCTYSKASLDLLYSIFIYVLYWNLREWARANLQNLYTVKTILLPKFYYSADIFSKFSILKQWVFGFNTQKKLNEFILPT